MAHTRVQKNGEVAYELELSERSKIHNVFHVSCLKKYLGRKIVTSEILHRLDDEVHLTLVPEKILKTRERRLRSKTIKEYLVQWKDIPREDSTWEEEKILQHPNMNCLRTRNIGWGGL